MQIFFSFPGNPAVGGVLQVSFDIVMYRKLENINNQKFKKQVKLRLTKAWR